MQHERSNRPLRVLIVADKFKGTLTAEQVTAAIAEGWSSTRHGDSVELLPMADGGDGFGRILGRLLDAEPRTCTTVDCAGRACNATWWFARGTKTAVIEAAEVNGLALLPPRRYHPFELDTFGLAKLLQAAAAAGAVRVYVGLGGSATNDGGFGVGRALGWRFLDSEARELLEWTDLVRLERIQAPARIEEAPGFVIAVDVTNPLLGPSGATRIFGPQKGLLEADLAQAEACLARLGSVARTTFGRDYAAEPGAGAAGGLGFALRAFWGGRFELGVHVFAKVTDLDRRITEADLLITAEGCFDAQSSMGKGVGWLAALAAGAGKPCLCLAALNCSDSTALSWPGFQVHSIVPLIADTEHSSTNAADCLRRLATHVASLA